jgi:hypothetical protein
MTPLFTAVRRGEPALVDLLLRRGADPNEVNRWQTSMLSWAVLHNHSEVVRRLLDQGAKIDTADVDGVTPLMYAVLIDHGDTTVLEQLLTAGANRNAKDPQGRTALDLARQYKQTAFIPLLAGKDNGR